MRQGFYILFIVVIFLITGCKEDQKAIDTVASGFPSEIGKLLLTKCAVSGCHNDESKEAASGLSLTSWENMMAGGNNGAVVVPFWSTQSTMRLFTNTFEEYGTAVSPTMPIGDDPLSKEEFECLVKWIDEGAPNRDGVIKFHGDSKRSKVYVTNQGCDLVTVIDRESNLIMNYVEVGGDVGIESPHTVRVSPDGKYWSVVFFAGNYFQVFDTESDENIASILLPAGSWNTIAYSSDSKRAFIVDWNSLGKVAVIDLVNFEVEKILGFGDLRWPHGVELVGDYLYVTANQGNFIYKADISDLDNVDFDKVVAEEIQIVNMNPSLDIHEIVFSPDHSKYYLTCERTNEVRVMDALADTLLAIVPTGVFPQEMSISIGENLLFVSCLEDETFNSDNVKGAVSVIDLSNNSVVQTINVGYQPHGIKADDDQGVLYAINRNVSSSGPPPHHATDCGGRNGYLNLVDLKTLKVIPQSRTELSVDPYFVDIRY